MKLIKDEQVLQKEFFVSLKMINKAKYKFLNSNKITINEIINNDSIQ